MLTHPDTVYIDAGIDFLDPRLYSSCRAPFGLATMLPRRAYTSEVFERLENEKVWTRDWVCIGTSPEIPDPLDLLPYTIGQHAIHVQRLPDGGLQGRFNKAQHGGCRTIPAQCRTGKKTRCSYTSCGFSRDRDVILANALAEMSPQMGQYLGAVPERLLPVKVRTSGPLIFANIDPTLDAEQRPLLPEWTENLVRLEGHWQEHRSNWKLAGATIVDIARSSLAGGGATNHVSAEWTFPNLVLVRSRYATLVVVLQPTALDQTLWRLSFFSPPELSRSAHEAACGGLMRLLDQAAGQASSLQEKIELSLASDPSESSRAGWLFNQALIERVTRHHVAYWSAPLMRA
ncbi:ring-hydroxylating oxygenase subunit alpha [Bradyrhizobium sp. 31Argb]|uniref:ring-hydroxylating oxygenase subunit alpha n=1 Tax=Bradyrhizobium sp. 31Argb TaxID=3141247 RepID=UPI00374A42DA